MKKLNVLFVMLLAVLAFANFKNNATPEFFAGKWDVLIAGTPGGDAKMIMKLENKEGVLSGSMIDPVTQAEIAPLTKILDEPAAVTVDFSAQGYDLSVKLEKKDDDNLTGRLMDMFDVTAKRIKE